MSDFVTHSVSVDCVIFDTQNRLLVIKRKNDPFKGMYALPGGFVNAGECLELAAQRELREETGVIVMCHDFTLVGAYSALNRDPRGPVISIAYTAAVKTQHVEGYDDAEEAKWIDVNSGIDLAFDHMRIVADARRIHASLQDNTSAKKYWKMRAAWDAWRAQRDAKAVETQACSVEVTGVSNGVVTLRHPRITSSLWESFKAGYTAAGGGN